MQRVPAVHIDMDSELRSSLKHAVQILNSLIEDIAIVVWLPDATDNNLIANLQSNAGKALEQKFRLAIDSGDFVTQSFVRREGIYGDDLNSVISETSREYVEDRNWKSGFAVPLATGQTMFGVLSIYKIKYQGISKKEQGHVRAAVRLMTDSLQNKYRSEQIEALYALARSTTNFTKNSQVISSQETLIEVADIIRGLVRADYVDIYTWNRQYGRFDTKLCVITPTIEAELPIPSIDGVTARILQSESILEYHSTKDSALFTSLERQLNIKSFYGIRMMADAEPIGVVYVNYCQHHPMKESDRQLLLTLAHHAAVAIREAKLTERLDFQVNALKRLDVITKLWTRSQNLSEVLDEIAKGGVSVLGADVIEIYRYKEHVGKFDLPPTSAGKFLVKGIDKSKIRDDDIMYGLIEAKEPQYYLDSQSEPSLTRKRKVKYQGMHKQRFVVREKIMSNVVVPLMAEGQKVGLLFINYRTRQPFPQEQKSLIDAFAAQAAVAMLSVRKTTLLQKAREIAESVHHELSIKKTLQSAIDGLANLFYVPHAGLVIYDRRTGLGHLEAEHTGVNYPAPTPPEENIPQVNWFKKHKRPLRVFDAQHDAELKPVWDRMKTRQIASIMIIPLFAQGGYLIGTIGLDVIGKRRRFSEEEADVAQLVANEIAIAYENANLYENLKAVNHFGHQLGALSTRAEKEQIVELISQQLVALVPSQDFTVALHDPKTGVISYDFVIQDGKKKSLSPRKSDPNQRGKTGWIISKGKPILNRTLAQSIGWYRKAKRRKPVPKYVQASFLGVPMLLHKGKCLGALVVSDAKRENVFDINDKRVLETMANHAAIALDNASLVSQLNRRIQGLTTLSEVGVELTSKPEQRLEEKDIVELICKQAQELTGCRDMYVALYDKHSELIRFPLYMSNCKRRAIKPRRMRATGRGKTEEIIQYGSPILQMTQEAVKRWYSKDGRKDYSKQKLPKSWLGVPMLLEGKPIGVIAVYDFDKQGAYDELEKAILFSMANYAAIALDNVTLFSGRKRALAALSAIAHDLSAITLSEESLIAALNNTTQHLTDASGLYFAFYDRRTKEIRSIIYREGKLSRELQTRVLDENNRDRTEEVLLTKKSLLHKTQKDLDAWYAKPNHTDFNQEAVGCTFIVPMIYEGQAIGAIAAFDTENENVFDEIDVKIMQIIASHVATAISNARLYEKVEKMAKTINAKAQLEVLGIAFATLQHRINNSFSLINPNISRLRNRVDLSDPETEKILDIIDRNSRDTSEIVARIIEPLKHLEKGRLNINSVLDDLCSKIEKQSEDVDTDSNLTIVKNLDDSIPYIEASLGQINEIFRNLMENACKAMKYRGTLTVASQLSNSRIEVMIGDTGPGIPTKIRERLFNQPAPSKEQGSGSGLGLWLSNLILEGIQGGISVARSDKNGTTMLVQIPVE